MNLFKKIISSAILALILVLPISGLSLAKSELGYEPESIGQNQQANKTVIEMFERNDCTHCRDAKAFFADYLKDHPNVQVNYLDLADQVNKDLWIELAESEGIPKVTPITLIGGQLIQGFDTAETTGRLIDDLVQKNSSINLNLSFREYIDQGGSKNKEVIAVQNGICDENGEECSTTSLLPTISIPFTNKTIDPQAYSLGGMAAILGFIDGFNPCAMWVLVTFLLVLIQIGDKKKMYQVAGLFILAEAIMYYLILNVWYQTWDFVGLDNIITPLIGLLAIGGACFFLYEWWSSNGECKVTNLQQRAKIHGRISKLVKAELTILTALGVIGVAFSVNIIEFACSVGIPQAFTKILELNFLDFWARQMYMAIYILMYMVDDFIVFGIALYSFEKIGLTTKYAKMSNLIGGILMLILGAILLFKPELLVF
jgi:hypothetical protein